MTIGSRLDTALADILVTAGRIADKLLNTISRFDEHAANRYLQQSGSELLAAAESEVEVFEPNELSDNPLYRELQSDFLLGEHPEIPPSSAPGRSSLRPVQRRPGPADPPPDAGPGHPTSDLLTAAANQLAVWRGTHWFRAVDDTDDRELSTARAAYLDELIPKLRDRAACFAAHGD